MRVHAEIRAGRWGFEAPGEQSGTMDEPRGVGYGIAVHAIPRAPGAATVPPRRVAIGFAIGLILAAAAGGCRSAEERGEADLGNLKRVEALEVLDGDSFTIREEIGGAHEIRVLGIDAPESGEPGYAESTHVLRDLLRAGEVRVDWRGTAYRPQGSTNGPLRINAYVFVDAGRGADRRFVDAEMVRRGAAYVYRPAGRSDRVEEFDEDRTAELMAAMDEAHASAMRSRAGRECRRSGRLWEHEESCSSAFNIWKHQGAEAYWLSGSGILHWEHCREEERRGDPTHADKWEAFSSARRRCQSMAGNEKVN